LACPSPTAPSSCPLQLGLERGLSFASKGDLLPAWLSETREELRAASAAWAAIGADTTQDELRLALSQIINTCRAHAALIAALGDEATQDSVLRDQLSSSMQRGIDALRQQITTGQREGWVDPDLLPAETAAWAIWLLERGVTQLLAGVSDEQSHALTDVLADMAWRLLYVVADD
jgi:hypothetical protein